MKKLLPLFLASSVACISVFLNMAALFLVANPAFALQISDGYNNGTYNSYNYTLSDVRFLNIQAKSSGVPVGTVISWPIGENPEDAENWLECDGRAVPAGYELRKYMASTPDYRGQFLRGNGGKAGALGVKQKESVHIPETAGISMSLPYNITSHRPPGGSAGGSRSVNNVGAGGNQTATFPLVIESREEETRPANVAVRYLIRAQ